MEYRPSSQFRREGIAPEREVGLPEERVPGAPHGAATPGSDPHIADDADFAPVALRPRGDGWTPARQRAFLENLASTGSVAAAARSVGLSRESAYALRRRADARGFAQAWDAARLLAAEHLVDLAWDRAVQGELRPLVYHGEVVAEVRHYDNRLLLGLIAQNRKVLVEQGLAPPPEVMAAVAGDWEAALDRAERGEALDPARAAPIAMAEGAEACVSPTDDTDGDDADDMDEMRDLGIDACSTWWNAEHGCWLTDWPAPDDWEGQAFRLTARGATLPIAADQLTGPGADGSEWPEWEDRVRTLTPAELNAVTCNRQARAARVDVYRRAAFGLLPAVEPAPHGGANPA
ncbi:MAG: hypothetical protein J0M19_14110 [Sphingomonadales bacterium]|nr:hypothetical protein [Sphingomonadales bacterium]